jgi:hypothetical protein
MRMFAIIDSMCVIQYSAVHVASIFCSSNMCSLLVGLFLLLATNQIDLQPLLYCILASAKLLHIPSSFTSVNILHVCNTVRSCACV